MKTIQFAVGLFLVVCSANSQAAFVSYVGGMYTQTFDAFGTTAPTVNNTSIDILPGWYVGILSTSGTGSGALSDFNGSSTSLPVDNGSLGTNVANRFLNYGTTGASERALGTLPTGVDQAHEVRFVNDTGRTIQSFLISYDGEQWRNNNITSETLNLQFSTDGVNYSAAGLGAAFDFTSPVWGIPATPLDGNAAANRQANRGGVFTPTTSISTGATFYFRWFNLNDAGLTDHGLAIDNFKMSVVSVSNPKTLVWDVANFSAGAWNHLAGNQPWLDGGTAASFGAGDFGTFSQNASATIAVDAGGVSAGTMNVSNSTGTYTFGGGSISGGSLNKSNAGIVVLQSENAFSSVNHSGGTIETQINGALGGGQVTLSGGGTWKLSTVAQTYNNLFAVGTGGGNIIVDGPGAKELRFGAGTASIGANTLTITKNAGSGSFQVGGAENWLIGNGQLNLINNDTTTPLILRNIGTFTGNVMIGGTGTTKAFDGANNLFNDDNTILTVNAGATFDFSGNTENLGGLNGGGTIVIVNSLTAFRLRKTGVYTFSGIINEASASGAVDIGESTVSVVDQTFSGNSSTYSGVTKITNASILQFTSIKNVGGGASSLGAPTTAANGTIALAAGARLKYIGSTDQISNRILNLTGAGAIVDASGTSLAKLTLTGGITGAAFNLVLDGTGIGAISGAIATTSGTVTKTGNGSWKLTGTSTYTGATVVSQGTLLVGADALISSNGPLGNSSSSVSVGGANDAALLIDGLFAVERNIVVAAGAGTTTLGSASATGSVFAGNITLNKTVVLTSPAGGGSGFSGWINDGGQSFGVIKTGMGSVILRRGSGNDYDGGTIINQGTLYVDNANSSATGTGTVVVNPSGVLAGLGFVFGPVSSNGGAISPGFPGATGTLTLNNLSLTNSAINLKLSQYPSVGTFGRSFDNLTVRNGLSLAGTNVVNITPFASLAVGTYRIIDYGGGSFAGGGSLVLGSVPSRGEYYLDTSNTGRVNFVVTAINSPLSLTWSGSPSGDVWEVNGAAGWNESKEQFRDGDSVSFNATGTSHPAVMLVGVLKPANISVSNGSYSFSGTGSVAGSTGLSVTTGTLTINNANTFSGNTTIGGGGTLLINSMSGSAVGTGALTVQSGGTLGGTGIIGAPVIVQSGGTYSPGASVNALTQNANLTFHAGSILKWEHSAGNALGSAGSSYDVVNFTSGILTIASGAKLDLRFAATTDFSNAFWDVNRSWNIANGIGGGSSGSFANADLALYINNVLTGSANAIVGQGNFTTTLTGSNLALNWTAVTGAPNFAFNADSTITFNIMKGATTSPTLTVQIDNNGTAAGTAILAASGAATVSPGTTGTVNIGSSTTVTIGTNVSTANYGTSSGTVTVTPNGGTSHQRNVVVHVGEASVAASGANNLNAFDPANALAASVGSGASYAVLSSQTTTGGLVLGTEAMIVQGKNATGGSEGLSMNWRDRAHLEKRPTGTTGLISDVLQLVGMSHSSGQTSGDRIRTDPFTLQMGYSPSQLFGDEPSLAAVGLIYMVWLDSDFDGATGASSADLWRLATLGNFGTGSTVVSNYQGPWGDFVLDHPGLTDTTLGDYLGSWGVDIDGNTVWAVLDHNSQFAAVPEPGTFVLLVLGLLGWAGFRRMSGIRHRAREITLGQPV